MSNGKEFKVNKKDFNRVLVTETTPYETPIIISNDGLYKNIVKYSGAVNLENLICQRLAIGEKRKPKYTIPYIYKINKNENEFRRLSVPHPIAQIEMRDFYRHYHGLITHFCSQSEFSIRAPVKIASTYYYKNLLEDRNLYKRGAVDMEQGELQSRYASSYFGYHGYDRLYKFYTSSEFLILERKFKTFYTLDVSKCFDSIYTHSISWATKDKLFTKGMLASKALNFGDAFDKLMQRCNFNETHGLIIGPEISRVFSEIIFQKIDLNVERKLLKLSIPLVNGIDYEIRRYVDDVFIFTKSESEAEQIYKIYSDKLNEYNMHINIGKVTKNTRPFLTSKSQVIHSVNDSMNDFIDSFLEVNENLNFAPKVVYRKNKLAMKFIEKIKILCLDNSVSYGEVSSYIISSIFERVKRLTSNKERFEEKNIYSAIYILLYVAFFFFKVSPSVNASYKLSSILIVSVRYIKRNAPSYSDVVELYIYDEILDFLTDSWQDKNSIEGLVNLEAYNVMYVVGELNESLYLPTKLVERVFSELNTYYDIVSCLYIINDNVVYSSLKEKVIEVLNEKFNSSDNILDYAEKAMLFLDVMSCPYIELKNKKIWMRNIMKDLQEANPTNKEIDDYISSAILNPWFVDWLNVDLLNLLEKKQLKKAY